MFFNDVYTAYLSMRRLHQRRTKYNPEITFYSCTLITYLCMRRLSYLRKITI